jgi:tetratricopeptide (TPR) repeat protein
MDTTLRKWSLALALVAGWGAAPRMVWAQSGAQGSAAAGEDRDRQVMERFLALLEKSPKRGTALDRVYGYHVERGTLDTFIQGYQDRAAKDPNDGNDWLLLGLLEAQRGRDSAAVAAFRKAEKALPDDALPSYYLGQALVLVGQPDAAAEAFERAIARKPARADLLEIFQALGRVHQRAHHNEQALAVWARLEKLFPDDARVQEQIAAALAEEAQPAEALPRFEALAKKATDPYRRVQFRIDAAELKVRLGRANDALADFEGLLGQLNPSDWLHREVRRKIEEVFLKNDDQAGLASYYEKWIAKNPEDVEAMSRLGRTLATLGRVPEAQKWFDKAVKLAPSRRELRLALVEQFVQEKKFAEAAAQYEAMAKADPGNPDTIRDWGRMLLRDTSRPEPERKKAAAAVWNKLIERRPKDPAAAVQVADLLRQAEMPEEAIAQYKRAITLAPDSPQYHEYLGEYYHTLKRPKEALAAWGQLAAGKNRNAKSLGRLAEVLAGFGYKPEALTAIADACALDKDSFELQIKYADLLQQLERYDDALKQLDVAAKAADDAEQGEEVLDLRIKTFQASGKLADQIEALRAELDAGKDSTSERWRTLARYFEADQKLPEAMAAIGNAVKLDARSVPSWVAFGRIAEASGDLGAAADAYRKLAALDRRALTEYLTQVAKLEMRLGRREQALKAGREVLAAAPGNPESYQFFADLCGQLGAEEEALDALRRAVRVNPADPKALLTLAENLARQFRTEEAIELYWRAFDKANDLDGKLSIVSRLTELYLQRNQFDRLIARLDREGREAKQPRETAMCLAQAYQASGDFGTARQELEKLLASNSRDTQLLQQLSSLAEGDGDPASAIKYQKQLNEVAPSDEGAARLAQLYLRAGEATEAEALWARLAGGKPELQRVLQAVDNLLTHGKPETVLGITERLLRDQPGLWEVRYREGLALAALEKRDEAARRFRAILDLAAKDDDESELVKAQKKTKAPPGGRPAGNRARQAAALTPQMSRLQERVQSAWQIRSAAGLEGRQVYYGMQNTTWSPADFGQARMASLAWLLGLAQKANTQDEFVKQVREAKEKAPKDARKLWDWYYLTVVQQEGRDTYESARDLARVESADPSALWVYLSSLNGRANEPGRQVYARNDSGTVDRTPPLTGDELDRMMEAYQLLRRRRPELADSSIVLAVAGELKRAKRTEPADRFYRETIEQANDAASIGSAIALASERGDVKTLFDLAEKAQRRWPTGGPFGLGQGIGGIANSLPEVMNARADAKAHSDILAILDRYLEWLRSPDQVKQRQRSQGMGPTYAQGNQYNIRVGKNYRYMQIDFPTPNRYFDQQSITLLRTAYELFRRDDLLSDLLAHFKTRVEAARDPERIYAGLALGYLQWWNDDKDEAVRQLARAVESAPADIDLRLELAEIRAKRNESDEALALVDSIEPLDQKTMQRRETMALRLAVLSGDVERARKAAERLFNLRLDTETQLNLAAQMHQLGMHDLAEAVLARARRRAGNNANTLVGLMQQYQRQNKVDVAVQVAHQILRRAPARQFNPYQDENDVAQREAIQVLARSGKLQELIGRVEAQLKTSPNSMQLLRALADYHKAAGERDKAKAVYARMVKIRPDDASLRYQVAQHMIEAGDAAAAIEHYRVAIKKEPSLFGYRYWEVQNAFQQANKVEDLAKLFEDIDLKSMGNYWTVQNLVQTLMQNQQTRDQGIRLFRRMWKAFPNDRAYVLGSLYDDQIWQLPEMLDYAREAVIPSPTQKHLSPWAGLDQITSWSGGGKVNGVANRLLEAASKQNKLEALQADVEKGLKDVPEWTGGKGLLAAIQARRGQVDKAKANVEAILERDKSDPVPHNARLIIGQEIEGYGPLEPLALTLYERANKEDDEVNGLDFEFHPVRRLIELYRKHGRGAEARDIVLKFARRPENNWYDPQYAAYQKIRRTSSVGQELLNLGYPADAVPMFSEMLADTETLRTAERFYGGSDYMTRELRQGLDRGLKAMTNAKTLGSTVRGLLKPGDFGGQALNLAILIHPRELDRAAVASLLDETIRPAVKQPDLRAEIDAAAAKLSAERPKDLSVAVVAALVAAAEGSTERLAEAAARLVNLCDEAPLDDLSAGARPNARQRAEAARRLGLWLVARECGKHEPTRAVGEALASRAVEAARRQSDVVWPLAMLREWGQGAADRGDRATGERRYAEMLDLVLANSTAPAPPPAPSPTPGPPAAARPKPGAPATTLERFDLAAQLAKLFVARNLSPLALRAIRETLRNGPPVIPMPIDANNNAMMMARRGNSDDQQDQASRRVEERLGELDRLWTRHGVPAAEVYDVLALAVLPEARSTEVFLFPQPLATDVHAPRSVAALLARWAVRAGKVDDLRKRVEARQNQAAAEVPAQVVLGRLGLASHDPAAVSKALEALGRRLQKDTLQTSAELACHVAVPALDVRDAAPSAVPVIEHAQRNLGTTSNEEPLASLHRSLARYFFRAGKPEDGRKQVQAYHGVLDRTMPNYGGDYGLYVRKEHLVRVASEYAKAGQWSDTLDMLGRYVDAPAYRGGDPSLGNVMTLLARQLAGQAAKERYDRLLAWTLPTANRKSVRLLASFVPEDTPPEVFGKFPTSTFDAGVAGTAGMLIQAAREAGTLETLAAEATKLADQNVENARSLLVLAEMARARGTVVAPRLGARVDELKKIASDNNNRTPVLWADALVARAALGDAALRDGPGQAMTRALLTQSQRTQNYSFQAHLRRDLAASLLGGASSRRESGGGDPGLALWHPATLIDAGTHAAGAPSAWWAADEGVIVHVTGPQDQLLMFDYPLTGRFEFSADVYTGGWAEGQVAYGGLVFEADSNNVPSSVYTVGRGEEVRLRSPFSRHEAFNRFTLQVEPGKVRCLVNGHLFYEDKDSSPTSPWVALFCSRARQSAFRDPRLTGDPEIPREVRLTHADRLEGWVSNFLGESQPRHRIADDASTGPPPSTNPDDYDWAARDGAILGRRVESASADRDAVVQSRLYYHRPLRDGESVSYEFYYEPDSVMVHPTIGRLAFLLEPEGVRVRWITDGADNEWTGLPTNNASEEPSNRRGPTPLPLKPKAWNAATLSLSGDTLALELNGVKVYERPLERTIDRQFGLYHAKNQTSAQARNVVLRGNWPSRLSAEQRADLAASRDTGPGSVAERGGSR